jgi:hypothetical protein
MMKLFSTLIFCLIRGFVAFSVEFGLGWVGLGWERDRLLCLPRWLVCLWFLVGLRSVCGIVSWSASGLGVIVCNNMNVCIVDDMRTQEVWN